MVKITEIPKKKQKKSIDEELEDLEETSEEETEEAEKEMPEGESFESEIEDTLPEITSRRVPSIRNNILEDDSPVENLEESLEDVPVAKRDEEKTEEKDFYSASGGYGSTKYEDNKYDGRRYVGGDVNAEIAQTDVAFRRPEVGEQFRTFQPGLVVHDEDSRTDIAKKYEAETFREDVRASEGKVEDMFKKYKPK